jgi:hypothetical protein
MTPEADHGRLVVAARPEVTPTVAVVAGPDRGSASGVAGLPDGCQKSAQRLFGTIMSRVAATALPDPGPAHRVADIAGSVLGVEGR